MALSQMTLEHRTRSFSTVSPWILLQSMRNAFSPSCPGRLSNVISGIDSVETLKYYNSEEMALERIERSYSDLTELFYNGGRVVIGFDTAAESLSRTLLASILIAGGFYSLEGEITAGELISFYTLCSFFTAPLNALINMNNLMAEADVSMERIFEILDADDESPYTGKRPDMVPVSPQEIDIKGLSFSYPGREMIFKNLNLTIKRGELTLVAGESGCGKSTLLSLITGEYPFSEGEITIGGISVRHIDIRSLREYITVVPQRAVILNCTLLQNIAPERGGCDTEKVRSICKRLNLDGMVKDLPFGLNTDLNEKGIKLSGGEIRRIAVARAIYRDTPVYLFDEPTASVDRENKRLVIREIDSLRRRNKSVVVVTHDIEAFYRYGAGIDKIIRIFRDKTSAHSAVEVCTPESQIF